MIHQYLHTTALERILNAISWKYFSEEQVLALCEIFEEYEVDNMMKANAICDCLDISVKDNRSAIYRIVNRLYPV